MGGCQDVLGIATVHMLDDTGRFRLVTWFDDLMNMEQSWYPTQSIDWPHVSFICIWTAVVAYCLRSLVSHYTRVKTDGWWWLSSMSSYPPKTNAKACQNLKNASTYDSPQLEDLIMSPANPAAGAVDVAQLLGDFYDLKEASCEGSPRAESPMPLQADGRGMFCQ